MPMPKLTVSERALIAELCAVGADAVRRGLVLASGGNLSARLAGSDRFVVTGKGTWLDRLTEDDFAVVGLDGEALAGAQASSEWKLHQRTYQVRDDATCVIHLHPQMSVLLATLGRDIRLLTLDHAFYVGSYGTTAYYPNGSDELADTAAEQAREHNLVVMRHHGCSAVADSVEMAYRRALNLEQAAMSTYQMLQLGDETTAFPGDELDRIHHA